MAASLACLIHALLPFLFVRTGSRAITELHDRMVVSRQRQATAPATATPAAAQRRVAQPPLCRSGPLLAPPAALPPGPLPCFPLFPPPFVTPFSIGSTSCRE